MRKSIRAVAIATACFVFSACAELVGSSIEPVATPSATIGGVGTLPDELSAGPSVGAASERRGDDAEPDDAAVTPATAEPPRTVGDPSASVGERVRSNRLLMIGDSVLASTATRFGGAMCDALVPLGWAVEIDAEEGRFVEFGNRVLDARLLPAEGVDWDAAVIMLGNNYDGDVEAFRAELEEILDRLSPRPTLLFNVTEYRDLQVQVNLILIDVAQDYPQVSVVDWDSLSSNERGVLGDDGLHLTSAGRTRLAQVAAFALGRAPSGRTGDCLSTEFTDDQPR